MDPTPINTDILPGGQDNNIRKSLIVLIAEDDQPSELFITRLVSTFSKKIITVRTGNEAVEACRTNPDIDLVLMDIKMPQMDGYEATRLIRKFNKDLIIIAQTAFGLTGEKEKAEKAGCNDYISKPIDRNQFLGLLQKYFGK
jgi:hypothetical protein